MSDADREKWDGRYASGDVPGRDYPSPVLVDCLERIGTGNGRPALDLACGRGRNALAMARAGFAVDAVDISPAALAYGQEQAGREGLAINWIEKDLDHGPLPRDDYSLIMVCRFHSRPAVPWLMDSLAEGGFLVYDQHFLTAHDVSGPKSRDFRLRPNELLRAFSPLRIVHYREAIRPEPSGAVMAIAEMIACNGDAGL